MQYVDQYNEAPIDIDPKLVAIPIQFFGESTYLKLPNLKLPNKLVEETANEYDPISTILPHRRSNDPNLLRIATTLSLQYKEAAILRTQYKALLKILYIPRLKDEVANLLSYISTLKKQAKSRLLLLSLYTKLILLQAEQQSRQKKEEELVFFNLVRLFTTIIVLDVRRAIYIGLSEFYNIYEQDEYQKAYVQRLLIRTTSSQFAYYSTRKPIFLADFTTFRCIIALYQKGYRLVLPIATALVLYSYLSRVLSISRDFRRYIILVARGQVVVQLQEVFLLDDLQGIAFDLPLLPYEQVLSQNNILFCSQTSIGQRFDIQLDYTFGNTKIILRAP